jgi:transketolase
MALYALLADKGFITQEQLVSFCRFDSDLGGHPEFGRVCGVEASTGSLGHGLSVGIGMAVAAHIRGEAHRVFVVMGDGELDEGSVWEAALAAGHHGLDRLTTIVDFNGMQSYGGLGEVWNLEPLAEKWKAFGFDTYCVDGHNVEELRAVLSSQSNGRPRAVIAETIKGRGLSFAEKNPIWHHKSMLTPEEIAMMREALNNA